MNLATMAIVTAATTVERLARKAKQIARVLGVVIIAVDIVVIARALRA